MSSFCYSIDGKEDEGAVLEVAIAGSAMTNKDVNLTKYDSTLGRVSVCMLSGLEQDDLDILLGLMGDLTPKAG